MDRISFDIFEPGKKIFRLTPNFIVYGLWFLTGTFLWIFEDVFPVESTSRIILLLCVGIVSLYYFVASLFRYEPLNGNLRGRIIFNNEAIIINEKVYELKSITDIHFGFINFYGERLLAYRGNFDPLLSQGVNNFVSFKDSTKKSIQIFFRIQGKHGSLALYPFINEAVKYGAMTYYHAIDLIDVENVRKPVIDQ